MTTRISTHIAIVIAVAVAAAVVSSVASADPSKGTHITIPPSLAKLHRAVKVTVRVTDAGVPVKGAAVRLGGHRATTSASGKATVHLTVAGNTHATASAAGYVSGSAELSAKR